MDVPQVPAPIIMSGEDLGIVMVYEQCILYFVCTQSKVYMIYDIAASRIEDRMG